MGELMDVFETDDFLHLIDSEDSRGKGVKYLEFACSAFFNKQLQCSDSDAKSLIVRGYGLFDSSYSFVYGKCWFELLKKL